MEQHRAVPIEHVEVRGGYYADSVTLMHVSATLAQVDGVSAAIVAMATELNLEMLSGMGFARPEAASPNELVLAVRASGAPALDAALALAHEMLTSRAPAELTGSTRLARRTVGQAAAAHGRGIAVISVPGRHAFVESIDALESGCDVLLFSDNVSVAHEILLKDFAAERDLIVMGPDCGTAAVGGVGLGFSHTVAPGPVGIVAASGTGAQQVMALLDAADVGVSAVIGVGGRDMSAAVGGRSTRRALRLLDEDPATEMILVISKPPADEVAASIRDLAEALETPIEFALLGAAGTDLTAATGSVLAALGQPVPQWLACTPLHHTPRPGWLRGLFCGGTLCDEAMVIACAHVGPILSNIPLCADWLVDPGLLPPAHSMIDFGDDGLTYGRAHPMIDPTLRNQYLAQVLADPQTAVVLLDVILGHGAHPDPVSELLPLIEGATVPVVVSLIGTRHDPQGLTRAVARLAEAGAAVFASNAAAARHAVSLVESGVLR